MDYTISKVAERTGLSSYTLRYYEKEGLLPEVKRNEKGIRMYGEEDIFWIELVKCLKDTGMSIAEIKHIIELSLEGDHTIEDRKNILLNHKVQLEEQIKGLQHCMDQIDKKLEWYEGKAKGC